MGVKEWTEKVGWALVSIKVIANDFLNLYRVFLGILNFLLLFSLFSLGVPCVYERRF